MRETVNVIATRHIQTDNFPGLIVMSGMTATACLQAGTINTPPLPLHDGHYDVQTLCTEKTVAVLPDTARCERRWR